MKELAISLKIIDLLADGAFHFKREFISILGTNFPTLDRYIKIVRKWGLDVFTLPGIGHSLSAPLQLLDKKLIHARLLDKRLEVLPIINSTNQYLLERIGTIKPGDACVAEYQAQGRGRHGRQWISPFGSNLYLSLYWRFERGLTATKYLSLIVSIVISTTLQRLGAKGIRIKWPNDLYLKNRKLAGILVESYIKHGDASHVVIGTGLNLTMSQNSAKMINDSWINLQDSGINIDRNLITTELINALRHALWQFERDGFTLFITRWKGLIGFI